MKFAYLYASSPHIDYPEIPALPPMPAIVAIESKELPNYLDIALNVAVVDIVVGESFSLEINIFHNGVEVTSTKDEYTPFRNSASLSAEDGLISRYSFLDRFLAEEAGLYTFVARLYEGSRPESEQDKSLYVHELECSIVVSKEWR